jgi:hypothetical protein
MVNWLTQAEDVDMLVDVTRELATEIASRAQPQASTS